MSTNATTDPIKAAQEAALAEYRSLLLVEEPTAAQAKKLFGLMAQIDFSQADVARHRVIVRRAAALEKRAAVAPDREAAAAAIGALADFDTETQRIVAEREKTRIPLAAAADESRRQCTAPSVAASELRILQEREPDLWPPEPLPYRPANVLPEPIDPWKDYQPAPYRPNTPTVIEDRESTDEPQVAPAPARALAARR